MPGPKPLEDQQAPNVQAPTSPTQTVVQPVAPQAAAPGPGGARPKPQIDMDKPQDVRAAPSAELGPGTGFINIDRYLQANQGIGGSVKTAGGKSLGESSSMFGTALGAANAGAANGVAKMPTAAIGAISGIQTSNGFSVNQAGSQDGRGASSNNTPTQKASDNPLGEITNALIGKYTGPTSIAYDPNSDEGMKTAKALASNATTGRVLAQQAGITGQYTPQLSAIDSALYGQVPDAVAATKGISAGLDANAKARVDGAAQFANTVKAKQEEAQSVADRTRATLLAAAQGIIDPAKQAADAANAQDLENFNSIGGNPELAGLYNFMKGAGLKTNREWQSGGTATAGNFINNQQAGGLANIAQLLNDPSLAIQSQGAYTPGQWLMDEARPVGDLTTTASLDHRPGDSAETTAGINQQQKAEAERMKRILDRQKNANNDASSVSAIVGGSLIGLPAIGALLGRK